MKYTLLCDDNFHFMDESERAVLGEFETAAEAIAAAKQIVERDLIHEYKPGMTSDELYDRYKSFGSDPFIRSEDKLCQFSAWEYAKQRSREICQTGSSPSAQSPTGLE